MAQDESKDGPPKGAEPDWLGGDLDKDLDPAAREAILWFNLLHADAVTAADKAAFRAWLRRDPGHASAYAEIERLWAGMHDLPQVKKRRRAAHLHLTRRTLGKTAIAALGTSALWAFYEQHLFADYRTGTGERRGVTLPDGSRAELSTATALSFVIRPELRLVTLYQGEAFFEVAENAGRPFVVEAGSGRTMALGTAFDVACDNDGIRITVSEHAVNVGLGAQNLLLEAGFQTLYDEETIGVAERVDAASELAWRQGRLVFVSAPFGRIVSALNAWRHGRLIIMDEALKMRPVTLIVDLARIGDILAVLEEALPIRVVNLTPLATLIYSA